MERLLHILGLSAICAACGFFAACVSMWTASSSREGEIHTHPSAIERFQQAVGDARQVVEAERSPLVAQAQVLAEYLNPPKRADEPPLSPSGTAASSADRTPKAWPVAPSAKFRLHGTSYYPNRPGRSMALIGELGAVEGSERWVKEGAQLGHFVIHEIRRGAIVYRDGEDLREMAVERSASPPSLVRDLRPGSLKVSAAMDGGGPILPAPSGPNGVETAGGN